MKVLLLGAFGQLAHDLARAFADTDLLAWTRNELDITDAEGTRRRIAESGAELVLNTAAYNLVDQAETEAAAAMAVNAFGPRHLAQACAESNKTLLHFSTDYVFGLEADRETPWRETDAPGPVSVYGASKLLGEYFVRSLCPRYYVVRTCGLYGVKGSRGKGGNFVETMLRLAGGDKPLRVVADQWCTPSYTLDVARAARRLVDSGSYGLYHLTNTGGTTWHELASLALRLAGKEVQITPITTAEFAARARRPAYSVLSNDKAAAVGAICPPWQDALARYLAEKGHVAK